MKLTNTFLSGLLCGLNERIYVSSYGKPLRNLPVKQRLEQFITYRFLNKTHATFESFPRQQASYVKQ